MLEFNIFETKICKNFDHRYLQTPKKPHGGPDSDKNIENRGFSRILDKMVGLSGLESLKSLIFTSHNSGKYLHC
jgi:hypothetical protein